MQKYNSTIQNFKELQEYWDASLPRTLNKNETIRVVSQVKEKNGEYGPYGIITQKAQFRSAEDVSNFLDTLKKKNADKSVGISISTAIFEYRKNEAPSSASFLRTKTVAIDIDTHITNSKERYILGYLEENQLIFAVIKAWLEITKKFEDYGIEAVIPKMTTLTGGGLQFIIEFNREINKSETLNLFNLLKLSIGSLVWKTVLKDMLGNYAAINHDIDKSFSDITHVQRCAGTINQKYNIMSRILRVFEKSDDELILLKENLKNEIDDTEYTDSQKETYKNSIDIDFKEFLSKRITASSAIDVENNLITAKMQSAKTYIKPSDLKNIEYDLLQKIKKENIDIIDLLRDEIRVASTSGNLTKIYCPFHEEKIPSFAIYKNELFDTFYDFHDSQKYSLITFWEKLFNVSKTTAISQISEKAGISLAKGERREFQDLEIQELIKELVKRIDTENFVYYRLASKNRTCIVRHIDSGEAFIFDGPKMLANHILQNQLNIYDAELKLQEEFNKVFQEKILVDAFEEFYPGKPTVFSKQFIKFVNLWVPSERYKRIHKRADEIKTQIEKKYTKEEAIQLLKRKTPYTYKYILQMVQNGDLHWFINWLVGVANFKTMPTVPVFFGVQGAGKNLFVNTVMDFYLNNEYVRVVSGDRIMQQFNSMLESTSLLVLDEGDFSTGKEVDQLKLLTGNDKILIEKKGIDATNKIRHFNILFFSNGEVPLRHPAMDRRITYFNQEISLLASCEIWNLSIDDFAERVKSEMVEFWAIMLNTELNHKQAMANCKNGQFWKQILMQHPFGALIVKLMADSWADIGLQLNENVTDPTEMKNNLDLLQTIKEQFETSGSISLTLINRYLQSLNFKMKQSIQKFIQINHLHEFGISINMDSNEVKIHVNKNKVQESLKVKNVLKTAYPKTAREEISSLEAELAMEEVDASIEAKEIFENDEREKSTPPPPPPPY